MRWRPWLVSAMVVATSGVAAAQHMDANHGFTWAVGMGRGSLTTDCTDCQKSTSVIDFGFLLRAGWNVRTNLVLAIESTLWENSELNYSQVTQKAKYDFVGAVALYYPRKHSEYFLKLGAGVAPLTTQLTTADGSVPDVTSSPPSFVVGAGIDINFSKSWSGTPFIDLHHGLSAKAKFDKQSTDQKVTTTLVIFGVSLTIH